MKVSLQDPEQKATLTVKRQVKQDAAIQALLEMDADSIEQWVLDSDMTDRELLAKVVKSILWLYRN